MGRTVIGDMIVEVDENFVWIKRDDFGDEEVLLLIPRDNEGLKILAETLAEAYQNG